MVVAAAAGSAQPPRPATPAIAKVTLRASREKVTH
jgi:hypothetical protein